MQCVHDAVKRKGASGLSIFFSMRLEPLISCIKQKPSSFNALCILDNTVVPFPHGPEFVRIRIGPIVLSENKNNDYSSGTAKRGVC